MEWYQYNIKYLFISVYRRYHSDTTPFQEESHSSVNLVLIRIYRVNDNLINSSRVVSQVVSSSIGNLMEFWKIR